MIDNSSLCTFHSFTFILLVLEMMKHRKELRQSVESEKGQ